MGSLKANFFSIIFPKKKRSLCFVFLIYRETQISYQVGELYYLVIEYHYIKYLITIW